MYIWFYYGFLGAIGVELVFFIWLGLDLVKNEGEENEEN